MRLTSLVPFRDPGALAQPSFGLFGLHREIDRLFDEVTQGVGQSGQTGSQLVPKIDIFETDKTIEVSAEMPGLEREDVQISIDEDNILTLRGEKKIEEDESAQHCERSYGVYYRLLQLPSSIDPSNVQATMSNGVLKISIPKPAKSEPKKIEVKEAKQEIKEAG